MTIHSVPGGIPADDISIIDGIPVTNPVRTLLDLATVEPEDVVERCLDEMLRRRIASLSLLQRRLADIGRKPHRGTRMLSGLVEARETLGITESPLETQVLKLLRDGGLPLPMLQYEVRDGDRFVARVDFAYPEQLVAIEVDGFRYHGGRTAFDHDRARGNELQILGWSVLRVTSKHLDDDLDAVSAWVRRALNR